MKISFPPDTFYYDPWDDVISYPKVKGQLVWGTAGVPSDVTHQVIWCLVVGELNVSVAIKQKSMINELVRSS